MFEMMMLMSYREDETVDEYGEDTVVDSEVEEQSEDDFEEEFNDDYVSSADYVDEED